MTQRDVGYAGRETHGKGAAIQVLVSVARALPVLAVIALAAGCDSQSSSFPSKSITIVVPWSAGGGTDALARSIARQATDIFGVSVNVLNKTGGQGTIGHLYGMQAFPDGYTATMITFELATYRALGRAHVDVSGFTPLLQLNEDPAAVTVRADSPYMNLDAFLTAARQKPNQVTIGNSGPGGVWHLAALQLEKVAGVEFTHIPFDGAAPAVVQLLGGHLDAVTVSPAEVTQHVQVGRLRILGVMAARRDAAMPDVPTLRERGVDVVFGAWRGLAVPAGTPPEIVRKLRDGIKEAYDRPEFKRAAANLQLGLSFLDGEAFAEALAEREAAAASLVRAAQPPQRSWARFFRRRGLFPILAAGALGVLLILLGLTSRRHHRNRVDDPRSVHSARRSPRHAKMAWALGALIAYWVAMYRLGYIGPTVVFLIFLQWVVMSDRRLLRVLLTSLGVTAALYLAFGHVLNVPLPTV